MWRRRTWWIWVGKFHWEFSAWINEAGRTCLNQTCTKKEREHRGEKNLEGWLCCRFSNAVFSRIYIYTYIYTCRRCYESGGSPVLQPPLQHRKQLWVLEMTPLSAGGRKAESKARNSTQQQHLHFYKLIAYTTTKHLNVWMQNILKSLILYTHLPSIDIVQDKVESVWCLEREVESHQEWML